MKKYATLLALPLLLFMFGCPLGLKFAPGQPDKEKIDAALLGNWATANTDAEFGGVALKQKDDYSFQVSVSDTRSAYGLDETEFTGWNTEVGGQKIVYILSDGDYYMYAYKTETGKVTIYDIALLDGGMDAVTSTEALRKQITSSLKKPECLNDPRVYEKK